ncbi:hypothetical protein [Streptomyces atratus]|uniref:Uncharacterized protein n=1 Tax=Streptomyces atratus TaxID=1893 RepID=A0A2Z5JPW0_STRAR|nr:hypothetical protein [Streptomyces atratus]AXE82338.1 hypothetical protein C5746_42055 [Streptomyces atratus]
MANCANCSTALDITEAANALAAEGHPVDHDDLATITPCITRTNYPARPRTPRPVPRRTRRLSGRWSDAACPRQMPSTDRRL